MDLVVGFDLDMTLMDTRPGIAATYRALVRQTGVFVDVDLAISRLGPPLMEEMVHWFPEAEVDEAVRTYRSLYEKCAIAPSVLLPGAGEAVSAVHAAGGQVAVITAKKESLARLHLDYAGLRCDHLVGDAYKDGKRRALRSVGATVYVGDHVEDMRAAVAVGAEVIPVGVTTGPCDAAALAGAGAQRVMPDLTAFPAWLRGCDA